MDAEISTYHSLIFQKVKLAIFPRICALCTVLSMRTQVAFMRRDRR